MMDRVTRDRCSVNRSCVHFLSFVSQKLQRYIFFTAKTAKILSFVHLKGKKTKSMQASITVLYGLG